MFGRQKPTGLSMVPKNRSTSMVNSMIRQHSPGNREAAVSTATITWFFGSTDTPVDQQIRSQFFLMMD